MSASFSPESMSSGDVIGNATIESLRAVIAGSFPELEDAVFRLAAPGWHSVAVDVDDRLIFKFPRHAAARRALVREVSLLARVRTAVSLPVPHLTLHEGPPLFSRHEKLLGEHLPPAGYEALPEDARERLAEELGQFYAELHALDIAEMKAAGARAVEPWQTPREVRERALPLLSPALRARAEAVVAAYEELPPDPYGTIYGFFDGHGWNMAFDCDARRLNGIYDFADSGLGPLHQDLIYSSFISRELTERIMRVYERMTNRSLDRRRITILTGFHRLSEAGELAEDREQAPAMVRHVAEWFREE